MDKLKQRWRELRLKYEWLDHVVRAYGRYKENQGDHQAAAVTFFSFLSIFPLLILAVSVLGFVLAGNVELRNSVVQSIVTNVPGDIVTTDALNKVIAARTATGVVGLVTLLLTGTSWVDNIRSAMESVWGRKPSSRNFLLNKLSDVGVLVVLAITMAVSFAITGLGTTLANVFLTPLGLQDAGWAATVAFIIGIVLAIAWDTGAFTVVLMKLPRVDANRSSAWRGALLAAIGFEILKIAASYYLASLSTNPAVVGFGAPVGILIFINLVCRYLLFTASWTSTFKVEDAFSPVAALASTVPAGLVGRPGSDGRPGEQPPALSPAAVGAGLVGAGAALGVSAVGAGRLYRRLDRRRRART